MELLDFPPEIFERIMAHYVRMHGIIEAWKIRGTCKPFLLSLDYEIYAKQPISAFLRKKENNCRDILRHNLGTYLCHRVIKPFDAHTFLPDFLNGMADRLITSMEKRTHVTTSETRAEYLNMLCHQVVAGCAVTWALVTMKSTSKALSDVIPMFSNNVEMDKVTAAAAVGNLRLFRELLQGDPQCLWGRSYAFGHPLAAAATGNHFEVVKAIVKLFESTYRQYPDKRYEITFSHAVEASLDRPNSTVAKLLLQVYRQYFPVLPPKLYQNWLSRALRRGNKDTVLAVTALRTEHSVASSVIAFEMVCKNNYVAKIKLFFEHGFLDINQAYAYTSCPLVSAVMANKIWPVREVLRLGADPDGVYMQHPVYSPLWNAVENNNPDILDELLFYGADPRNLRSLWRSSNAQFRYERGQIGSIRAGALSDIMETFYANHKPSKVPRIVDIEDVEDL